MKTQKKLQDQKFHFVGIGGIGMCGLAELLHNMGAQVTGSDLSKNANTEHLKKLGVHIFKGHQSSSVGNADVVVYSSAVSESNPEIQAARAQRIPLIPRAEALSEIMRLKRGVAVGGTHGKTTTTSLAASIFLEAKNEPTIMIGGRLDLIQSTAKLGAGEWMIAEADESDGSFSKLSPEIAIVTNIDSDHLDYFKTFENLQKAFWDFAGKVPFYGLCIACGDDLIVRQTFKDFPKRILFYGFGEANDYVIKGSHGRYELVEGGISLGFFHIKVPGVHNALNATAAIVAGLKAGIDFDTCCKGLLKFEGVDRRFQFKGEAGAVKVYDDYGHHPTEVRATLQAFREKFPKERLVVMFQPHRFSRTQSCWHEFTTCFQQADELMLTDIYGAGESALAGITSEKLAAEIKGDLISYTPKSSQLAQHIRQRLVPGDVFITLGAGDGWKVGMEVLELLKK
jgi:UDP-N-acetylmuramate--alanine ligase